MIVVRPRSKEEFRKVVEEAKKQKKLLYISAFPCPECEVFEASLELLEVDMSRLVKVDVPDEEWAIEYVLSELRVSGAPSIIAPDGKVLDNLDPLELAKKVKELIEND